MSSDALVAVTYDGDIVIREDLTLREACDRVISTNSRGAGAKPGCASAVAVARLISKIADDRDLLTLYSEYVDGCRTRNEIAKTPDQWLESTGRSWNVKIEKQPLDDVTPAFPAGARG